MPSHEPDELRRMHETIDTYYPKTYLDCWAAVYKTMYTYELDCDFYTISYC